jgi:hypothetical protein
MARHRSLQFLSVLVLVAAGASFGVGLLDDDLTSVYASIALSFVAAALLAAASLRTGRAHRPV